jgi:hypothetical protein
MKDLKHIRRFNESDENLNISDVSRSNFINIQFEFIEFDDNIEKGDFFIVGDTIHCCKMLKGSILGIEGVVDTEGNIHEPDSIKGIIVNPKLIK